MNQATAAAAANAMQHVLPGIHGFPMSQRPLLRTNRTSQAVRAIHRLVEPFSFDWTRRNTSKDIQVTGAMLLGSREHAGKLAYLLGVDNFKFRKTVTPGDRVVIETEALRIKERVGQARVKATVDNHVVCEGTIKFMLIDATAGGPGAVEG